MYRYLTSYGWFPKPRLCGRGAIWPHLRRCRVLAAAGAALLLYPSQGSCQAVQLITARAQVAEPAPGAAAVARALLASVPGRATRVEQGLVSVRVVRPRNGGRGAFVTVHFLRN